MATNKEKLAKKNPGNVFALMDGKSLICGFHGILLPVDMREDFECENGKGARRLVKPSEIAPLYFDPAYILENKMPEETEGSLSSDYLEDFEPSVAIDNVTVQGMPLVVYLKMYNIDSDPPSLADGIPVTQYVQGMSYDRIYPIIMDDGKSGYGDDMTISHEGTKRAVFVQSHNCRIYDRSGRRYGKPPEQKPRYKDISRQTHRSLNAEEYFSPL